MKPISLNQIIHEPDYTPEISFDTELSLSVIESGCLFIMLNEQSALIIKAEDEEISELRILNQIKIGAELIERPEFPTLKIHFEMEAGNKRYFNFEYFFNTESNEEVALLRNITAQNHLDIIFYASVIKHCTRVELNTELKNGLKSLLQSVSTP